MQQVSTAEDIAFSEHARFKVQTRAHAAVEVREAVRRALEIRRGCAPSPGPTTRTSSPPGTCGWSSSWTGPGPSWSPSSSEPAARRVMKTFRAFELDLARAEAQIEELRQLLDTTDPIPERGETGLCAFFRARPDSAGAPGSRRPGRLLSRCRRARAGPRGLLPRRPRRGRLEARRISPDRARARRRQRLPEERRKVEARLASAPQRRTFPARGLALAPLRRRAFADAPRTVPELSRLRRDARDRARSST